MKFLVLVAVVSVAVAKPQGTWHNAPGGGQYVVTYDNSWEGGVRDTSIEYVRPVGAVGARTGAGVSVNSVGDTPAGAALYKMPYAMGLDSSEEMFYAAVAGKPTTYSHADRVKDLTYRLNSGLVDLSDELQYQYNMQWAQRNGAQNYYINNSGELFYRPGGAQGGPQAGGPAAPQGFGPAAPQAFGPQAGGPAAPALGSAGVQAVKK